MGIIVRSMHIDDTFHLADDRLNKKEGWALFATDTGKMQIQRLDTSARFMSDGDAFCFVADRALKGSIRHLQALVLHGQIEGDNYVFFPMPAVKKR